MVEALLQSREGFSRGTRRDLLRRHLLLDQELEQPLARRDVVDALNHSEKAALAKGLFESSGPRDLRVEAIGVDRHFGRQSLALEHPAQLASCDRLFSLLLEALPTLIALHLELSKQALSLEVRGHLLDLGARERLPHLFFLPQIDELETVPDSRGLSTELGLPLATNGDLRGDRLDADDAEQRQPHLEEPRVEPGGKEVTRSKVTDHAAFAVPESLAHERFDRLVHDRLEKCRQVGSGKLLAVLQDMVAQELGRDARVRRIDESDHDELRLDPLTIGGERGLESHLERSVANENGRSLDLFSRPEELPVTRYRKPTATLGHATVPAQEPARLPDRDEATLLTKPVSPVVSPHVVA